MTTWQDLDDDERTALKRLNRGPYPALPEAVGNRLIALGLAERDPDPSARRAPRAAGLSFR